MSDFEDCEPVGVGKYFGFPDAIRLLREKQFVLYCVLLVDCFLDIRGIDASAIHEDFLGYNIKEFLEVGVSCDDCFLCFKLFKDIFPSG